MCYGGCNCRRCRGEEEVMTTKQWVQHISGQGEKFQATEWSDSKDELWRIIRIGQLDFYLPKSEYHLCDPPEVWEDVTGECYVVDETDGSFPGCIANGDHYALLTKTSHFHKGMCLRKIDGMHNGPAFIIERKKP